MAVKEFSVEHISTKDIIRFFSKVRIGPESWNGIPCWVWTAFSQRGYGSFAWKGLPARPHRLMYAWLVGPIPKGNLQDNGKFDELDHLCRNRRCCNPVHLELVPRQVNNSRSMSLSGQHTRSPFCVRGHWKFEHGYLVLGYLRCRLCTRIRDKARAPRRRKSA